MAWFHTFFDKEYVEMLRVRRSNSVTSIEAKFIQKHLRLRKGKNVLDAPCGFGRHALKFARFGCNVTGVDLSKAMLAARKRHTRISYERMDIRRMKFVEKFDGIFSSSNGYFSDRDNRKLLKTFAKALKPGGRAMLWTFSVKERAAKPESRSWAKHGGRYIFSEQKFNLRTGLYEAKWYVWRAGFQKPWMRKVQVRGYSVATWRRDLKNAGLKLIAAMPKPTSDGDGVGLALLAEKPR